MRVRQRRHRAYLCTHHCIQYWLESRAPRRWIWAQIQRLRTPSSSEQWVKPNQTDVKLNPRTPPGRSNRKARAFSTEIARLVAEGYGSAAIQQALADAGVSVSKSTVQREVARLSRLAAPINRRLVTPIAAAWRQPEALQAPTPDRQRPGERSPSSKDIAEAFIKGRITNPLMRKRN
jgi:hypothetical protein